MAKELKCPFTRKACMGHDCMLYRSIAGTHPQTGAPIDKWDCTLNLSLLASLEVGKLVTRVSGETHELRKEVTRHDKSMEQHYEDSKNLLLSPKNDLLT